MIKPMGMPHRFAHRRRVTLVTMARLGMVFLLAYFLYKIVSADELLQKDVQNDVYSTHRKAQR